MSIQGIERGYGIEFSRVEAEYRDLEAGIPVSKEIVVTFNYSWVLLGVTGAAVSYPDTIYGQVFLTAPGSTEVPIITIKAADLFPDGNCVGPHSKVSMATPHLDQVGRYVLRMTALHTTQSSGGESVVAMPSIVIVVDGKSVVNRPYPGGPSPDGTADDAWNFDVGPQPTPAPM